MTSFLLRGSFIILVIRAFDIVITYVSQMLFARWLGLSGYGTLAIMLAIGSMGAPILLMGLNQAALRFIPQYRVQEKWGRLKGFLYAGDIYVYIGLPLVAILSYLMISLIGDETDQRLWFGVLLACVNAGLLFRGAILRAWGSVITAFSGWPLARLLLLVFATALHVGYDGEKMIAVNIVIAAIAAYFIVATLLTIRDSMLRRRDVLTATRNLSEMRHWFKVIGPLWIFATCQNVMNQSGILVVGLFSTAEEAGLFGAASKIALLISFFLVAVNSFIVPMTADLYYGDDKAGLEKLLRLGRLMAAVPAGSAFLILALFGEQLLGLFGAEFTPAFGLLLILAAAQFSNTLVGPAINALGITGNERDAWRISTVSAVVLVATGIPAAYVYGAIGMAICTGIVIMLQAVVFSLFVYRRLGIALWRPKINKAVRDAAG